jgi:hypothetical protein
VHHVGEPHVRAGDQRQSAGDRKAEEAGTPAAQIRVAEKHHEHRDAQHVGIKQVRDRQDDARQHCREISRAALHQATQVDQHDQRKMHRPDLSVEPEAAPDVAVVLEAVAMVGREQARRGRARGRRYRGKIEAPHRPEDRERKRHQQEKADGVENRQQIELLEQRAVQRDDGQMGQVLVIEKEGEAELELRQPMIEDVFSARQRLARALDKEIMDRVVVQARNRQRYFREKINRVEDDGNENEQREGGVFPTVGAVLKQAIALRENRSLGRVKSEF